ncbi:Oidioi.mRNA.OKI2018_I69.chr1.g2870.t1.cds [Oikopleura dioica]|uniref:Oidioi.mRNA.OKI2018_I69.chr1.g2870.t1.cds n=1 Tax=Oikopleura dioica TaxID=34765 RepID=A0ABN7SSB6_OIKDI|nr:Oidioi.mRNA.OKI2018_I69.chr1.g2870.t1.cds [Oikopleura dioica]
MTEHIEEIATNHSDSGCGGSSGGESPQREKLTFDVRLKAEPEEHMQVSMPQQDNSSEHSGDSRRKRNFVDDKDKDESYWVKRKKNNEAARRSREKRRMNDLLLEQRVVSLTEENKQLKGQLLALKLRYGELEEFKPKSAYEKPGQLFTNRNGDTSATVLVNSPEHLAQHLQARAAAAHHHHMAMNHQAPSSPPKKSGGFSIDNLLGKSSSDEEMETNRPPSTDSGNNSDDVAPAYPAGYSHSLYNPMMYAHLAKSSPYLLNPALMAQQKLYGMN